MTESSSETRYAYAHWDEGPFYGEFESRDRAREEGVADGAEDWVYTGLVVSRRVADFVSLDSILDQASENACDAWPDHQWQPCANKEAAADFYATLNAWADRWGLQPNFFTVAKVEAHEVGEGEDV